MKVTKAQAIGLLTPKPELYQELELQLYFTELNISHGAFHSIIDQPMADTVSWLTVRRPKKLPGSSSSPAKMLVLAGEQGWRSP